MKSIAEYRWGVMCSSTCVAFIARRLVNVAFAIYCIQNKMRADSFLAKGRVQKNILGKSPAFLKKVFFREYLESF